jgi:hypothetical protein
MRLDVRHRTPSTWITRIPPPTQALPFMQIPYPHKKHTPLHTDEKHVCLHMTATDLLSAAVQLMNGLMLGFELRRLIG